MIRTQIQLINLYQLQVRIATSGDEYSFYLIRGKEVIEKIPYGTSNEHVFNLEIPGKYKVKGYVRNKGQKAVSGLSEGLVFRGIPRLPSPPKSKDIAIFGISRTNAFASKILDKKYNVVCFVDQSNNYLGQPFFDFPVLANAPSNCTLVGHENYLTEVNNLETFSMQIGTDDILNNVLHGLKAIDLYRISRDAYLNGLTEGAHYTHRFILARYSAQVPFTAEIGAGTRLGLDGLGIAIHPRSKIGRDCIIGQNATLGARSGGNGTPILGNNVFVGPGAKCLGGRIGDNVVVGANAVVLSEVPSDSVVAGVPAKVVSRDIAKYRNYTHRYSKN